MLHPLRTLACALLLAAAPLTAGANEAGALVFANRAPWDLGGKSLEWQLIRKGPDLPGFAKADDGRVTMTEMTDPVDGKPALQVVQKTDAGERRMGPLPVAAGDPVLVLFLENTARDMATMTGGSPDYIRNRIKDAVFRGGTVTRKDGSIIAEMKPFENDPNKDRMGGFSTLTLRFVMDDDATQPIRELVAETPEPVIPAIPRELAAAQIPGAAYLNRLVLK